MSDIVVSTHKLGKQYRIARNRPMYPTLRETIMESLTAPFQRLTRFLGGNPSSAADLTETIWALRDVSFELHQGEILGIIGRNGAGKSTLLKVLTRITEPSAGEAFIRGRVGSLLEVGAGFHPELTGRENIFLNGAILGMRNAEICRKFDEIVAFAEIEQFLDTPVKHYSSGMFVRLAFAIAAHLEPDVLIVDEVLAVGDAAFQKKCLGKMDLAAHEGRTILFVSHNLAAIGQLCTRCILLKDGNILTDGLVDDVIQQYINEAALSASDASFDLPTDSRMGFKRIWITDRNGNLASEIDVLSPLTINMLLEVRSSLNDIDISLVISNIRETPVTSSSLSHTKQNARISFSPGEYCLNVEIPGEFLVPDIYKVSVSCNVRHNRREHSVDQAINFVIVETGSNLASHHDSWRLGCVLNNFSWTYDKAD